MKIKMYNGRQPILNIEKGISAGKETDFGVCRDPHPDRGWGEIHSVNMEMAKIVEVDIADEGVLLTLLTDLAYVYGNDSKKFKEELVKYLGNL
jgi:hypothetical protein